MQEVGDGTHCAYEGMGSLHFRWDPLRTLRDGLNREYGTQIILGSPRGSFAVAGKGPAVRINWCVFLNLSRRNCFVRMRSWFPIGCTTRRLRSAALCPDRHRSAHTRSPSRL